MYVSYENYKINKKSAGFGTNINKTSFWILDVHMFWKVTNTFHLYVYKSKYHI